ncbi:MAG TPA: hypothetical protein PKA64_13140 [Myxococcota bacterium]|nr:hypothetical protein [Myxococcota bacterium]
MITALLGAALAHGVDAGVLLVDAHGAGARLAATPPATLFAEQDLDHDGLLDLAEVEQGREAILERVRAHVRLVDERGRPGAEDMADVVLPEAFDPERPGGRPHLRVILGYHWDRPPEALALDWTLFHGLDDPPMTLQATRDGAPLGAWRRVTPLDGTIQLYGEPAPERPSPVWLLLVPAIGLLGVGFGRQAA